MTSWFFADSIDAIRDRITAERDVDAAQLVTELEKLAALILVGRVALVSCDREELESYKACQMTLSDAIDTAAGRLSGLTYTGSKMHSRELSRARNIIADIRNSSREMSGELQAPHGPIN